MPSSYELENPASNQSRALEVNLPSEELVLQLRRLPHLLGRILHRGGRPASKASVQVQYESGLFIGGGSGSGGRANEDGRFAIPMRERTSLITVFAHDAEGNWATEIEAQIEDLSLAEGGDVDLGDIELGTRTISVRVLDPGGDPIQGADLRVRHDFRRSTHVPPRAHTDELGHAKLPVPLDRSYEVSVGAEGSWPTRLRIGPDDPRPVEVTLHPVNRLLVTVGGVPGSSASGIHLSVHRDPEGGVFAERDVENETWVADESHGQSHWSRFCPGEERSGWGGLSGGGVRIELCSSGRLELTALWPDVPIALELSDETRSPLLSRILAPLGSSEVRHVELSVSRRHQ